VRLDEGKKSCFHKPKQVFPIGSLFHELNWKDNVLKHNSDTWIIFSFHFSLLLFVITFLNSYKMKKKGKTKAFLYHVGLAHVAPVDKSTKNT